MSDPGTTRDSNWPKDEFGRREIAAQLWWWIILLMALLSVPLIFFINWARSRSSNFVVAYCAQDQIYAEPFFKDFEKITGIQVRAVYDSEAVKTVGLANRLLAEKDHPQADVFWGNEEMRTRQLAAQDVFRETNGWTAFGYRSRRVVINTNQLSVALAPHSLLELTNQVYRHRIALAYPQFGTTSAHFHALRQHWGEPLWLIWCRALAANQPYLVDGNSAVVKIVGRGDASLGLTDSDDIAEGRREGLPLIALPINAETLLIPNTIAVTRHAPHPAPAEELFQFLQSRQRLQGLISAGALEGALLSEAKAGLQVDWPGVLHDLQRTTAKLNEIFLR